MPDDANAAEAWVLTFADQTLLNARAFILCDCRVRLRSWTAAGKVFPMGGRFVWQASACSI